MSRLRFKLSKAWSVPADDPVFNDLNTVQWRWYAHMFAKEEEEEFDKNLGFVEYLAQFWNPEAVKKIRDARESRKGHTFLDDAAFEDSVVNSDYKNNPIIKAIQEMRRDANLADKGEEVKEFESKKIKAPLDLDSISKYSKI